MATVISTSSTTAGTNIDLAVNEDLYIRSGVTRASTGGVGILANDGGHAIDLLGHIYGETIGISLLDTSSTSTTSRLSIAAGATVASHDDGVRSQGTDVTIVNAGYISGNTGVIHTQGGLYSLINTGTIVGGYYDGVNVNSTSGTIINHGSIVGGSSGYGVVVDRFGDTNLSAPEVINYGDISSRSFAIVGDSGNRNTIHNYGKVAGNVVAGSYDDDVINAGTIDGEVGLSSGNDHYRGTGGFASGEVSGGGGNDRLVGGSFGDMFSGDSGDDTVIGGAGDDTVDGGADSDLLLGGDGDDTLYGSGDNDILRGGEGADFLDGGDGTGDVLDYRGSSGAVMVDLGTGDTAGGDANDDTIIRFERIFGTNYGDVLTGDGVNNVLRGRAGADVIDGAAGADLIVGGSGADMMVGGGGRDRFDYNNLLESGTTGLTRDVIGDFTVNPVQNATYVDRIDLSTIDASISTGGDQAFVFVGQAGFSAEGQVRAVQSGGDTIISVNVSGTSGAEMQIVLTGVTATDLTAVDFIL